MDMKSDTGATTPIGNGIRTGAEYLEGLRDDLAKFLRKKAKEEGEEAVTDG